MLKGSKGKVSSKIQQGFTIIEVIIVLVIAAIIMLMVFLVVPQLQRTQRNSKAQTVARQAFTAAEQSAANNGGTYPTADATGSALITAITDTLKNGNNATYTFEYNTAPTASDKMSISVAGTCSTTPASIAYFGGTKFMIVVNQETASSTTGGKFCISN